MFTRICIESYQNAEWGKHQGDRAISSMHYLDEVLSERPYVAGQEFSVADITAFAGLSFADFVGIETPADCINLAAWRAKVEARPSIAG